MEVKVLERQSLFDLAIQTAGSAEAAFALAGKNNMGLTDELVTGQDITLSEVQNREIVKYYADRKLKPATGNDIMQSPLPTGINYMIIEQNFIVV